ncbi:Protein ACTIVITY OF BC1 COMPLEX KINASE 3, chloroplastic [Linum grandiflorum]
MPMMSLVSTGGNSRALGSFGLKVWLDGRNGVFDQNKRIRTTELRKIFTRLGPTFVKLGQGLSTRPDICPPEFLEELAELQDDLPTFPDDEAFACIETELGVAFSNCRCIETELGVAFSRLLLSRCNALVLRKLSVLTSTSSGDLTA